MRTLKLSKPAVLETDRLSLRLVRRRDLPALLKVNGDSKVFRYTPRTHWKSLADAEAWFARITKFRRMGATIQFVITLRDSGLPVGTLALFHYEESVRGAEVGYILGRKYWGQGLMKEALRALVGFAFDTLNLKRLEAELDPRNPASAKVLERVGFSYEGRKRRNFFAKGEFADTAFYGMLSGDPRP